jgi:hypothetical protein
MALLIQRNRSLRRKIMITPVLKRWREGPLNDDDT